jgi:DNA-binding beta-propeller fold protein YncE
MNPSVPATRTLQSTSTRTSRARQLATGLRVGLLSILTVGMTGAAAQAQTLVATVPAGPSPIAVALNQTTNTVYVADNTLKTLLVMNGATNATTTIQAGATLAGVAVNATTNTVYAITTANPASVVVIDGATNAVTTTITLTAAANLIAVNSTTNNIYVADGDDLTVVDGASNTITTNVSVPQAISSLAVDSTRNVIWVLYGASGSNSTLAQINGATNTAAATVQVGVSDTSFALNATTNKLYVPDAKGNQLYVVDGGTIAVTDTIAWPNTINGGLPAVNPATNTIYVNSCGGNVFIACVVYDLSVLNGATNTVTTSVGIPSPGYLLVDTVANQVLVESTPVVIINGATNVETVVNDPADEVGINASGFVLGAVNSATNDFFAPAINSVFVISGGAAPSGPAFSASPSPLAFGNQTEGTTSNAMTLTITNTGTSNLDITTVTPGGANMADFPIASDNCANATVAAGKTCTISIKFDPSTTSSETATLTFADNAPGSPQTVNLTGTGVAVAPPVPTATTTKLAASSGSVAVGTSVTLTATVTPASGTPTPTGTVTFKDGATTLGTGTLNGSGVATYTASALALGSHTITASYAGDARNIASTSSSVTVVITAGSTSTALTASASSIAVGSSVTFTATVTGTSPTGTVTFKNGPTTLGTGTLNGSGVATYSSSALAAGSYSVTAAYGGDTDNASSTSSAIALTVYAGAPAFTLTLDPATGTFAAGKKAVVTVTVASMNGFNAATSLTCSGLPKNSTCTFSSASITPTAGGTATSTLTIATNTQSSATALLQEPSRMTPDHSPIRGGLAIAGAFAAFLLLPLLGAKNRKIRRRLLMLSSVILVAAMISLGMTGCAGGPTTPKGTYTIQVTGTAGSLSQNATYTLIVQ